ncbi:MAG: DUF1287 domain-containing protein [Verrucomicrobiaceae bacterium]|nr:DUF1287 domain-containing protein [Verrucomicrobiaceae bacterium]
MTRPILVLMLLSLVLALHAQSTKDQAEAARRFMNDDGSFAARLVHAALDRTHHVVRYEPAYVKLSYPGGDVPTDTGVCTDEVIRSYRKLGHDLQKLVHEDMKRHFSAYPKNWGLARPDPNIDHRRVPNLQTFFKRQGASLPATQNESDYKPGDLITCTVAGKLPHIALVVPAPDGGARPWIVHNIGQGPQCEDRLFEFPLTGHYRWHPGR